LIRPIALLDRPSAKSFGMAPVAMEDDGGKVQVVGLAQPSAHRGRALTVADVNNLVTGGHALQVTKSDPLDDISTDNVALWLGDAFLEHATALQLGLPVVSLPTQRFVAPGGVFFLAPPALLYPYLERWIAHAFKRFVKEPAGPDGEKIASLMHWTLPDRPETLAARWKSSRTPDQELEWQLRTFARGRPAADLVAQHQKVLRERADPFEAFRIVLFTGGTGTLRGEVAKRFAERFSLDLVTFKDSIGPSVRSAEQATFEQKLKEMREGQKVVDRSPLALALSVLKRRTPLRPNIFAIDSLRHKSIREAVKWLDPKRVEVVSVAADEATERRRVIEKYGRLDILNDPTETEIPTLADEAEWHIEPDTADGQSKIDEQLHEIFESIQR
jgi:hypothetical protein